jgi:hypothetical protein
MSNEYLHTLDPARQKAVTERTSMVQQRYPTASFAVGPGEGDPVVTHITTTVDIDDAGEVVDLVIDRMLELQIDEGVPVYAIPIRTPERVVALRQYQHTQERSAMQFPLPPASAR